MVKKSWNTLKLFNGVKKPHPPNRLIHDRKIVSSPQRIAEIQNIHYINKIAKIREKFQAHNVDPMDILQKLRPKNKNSFELPLISVSQTKKIIRGLSNSNSTGWDSITNTILKKINTLIAPHICHLINSTIRTKTFPLIFKLSKILPLSKPDKDPLLPDSFRPINNLPLLEKIFEEFFLLHFIPFLNENKVIHNNHHGGRAKHSPLTAMTEI